VFTGMTKMWTSAVRMPTLHASSKYKNIENIFHWNAWQVKRINW
jgi:hypothetical protein